MKKVLLYGGVGAPNFGDEAILAANLDFYEEYFPGVEVVVFTGNSNHTALIHSRNNIRVIPFGTLAEFLTWAPQRDLVQAGDVAGLRRLLRERPGNDPRAVHFHLITKFLSGLDAVHLIGGGYFHGGFPHVLSGVGVIQEFAEYASARVVCTGLTLGPFDTPESSKIAIEFLRKAELIDLRDHRGVGWLEEHSLRYAMSADDFFLSNRSWQKFRTNSGKPVPFINVVFSADGMSTAEADAIYEKIDIMLDEIINRFPELQIRILLFAPESDGAFAATSRAVSTYPDRIAIVDVSCIGVDEAFRIVGSSIANIGSRLHLAVLSFAFGVPVFSQHYGHSHDRLVALHEQFSSTLCESVMDVDSRSVGDFIERSVTPEWRSEFVQKAAATRDLLHFRKANSLLRFYFLPGSAERQ